MPFLMALLIFSMIYSGAEHLPVLGDGAHHAWVMQEIADRQSLDIGPKVYYPMFYHVFGTFEYIFFGITGVKLLSPLAIALSGLVVYLIAIELTGSRLAGLCSMLLLAFSAKLIWYGAQILMEPCLILFILLSLYTLILLYRNRDSKTLVLAALMMGAAISTKQLALFIIPVVLSFLLLSRIAFRKVAICLLLVTVFAIGPYSYMWSSTHTLVVPYMDYSAMEKTPFNKLLYDGNLDEVPAWSSQLTEESDAAELYARGTTAHEARHIYIWDMVNRDKFLIVNSLYLSVLT